MNSVASSIRILSTIYLSKRAVQSILIRMSVNRIQPVGLLLLFLLAVDTAHGKARRDCDSSGDNDACRNIEAVLEKALKTRNPEDCTVCDLQFTIIYNFIIYIMKTV